MRSDGTHTRALNQQVWGSSALCGGNDDLEAGSSADHGGVLGGGLLVLGQFAGCSHWHWSR
jgi:hypothetical protein